VPSPDRRATLRAALGFAGLESCAQELRILHAWLDTWRGIGDVVAGMARQDFDLELRRFDGRGWRATFFPSGFEHSFTSTARRGPRRRGTRCSVPRPQRSIGSTRTSRCVIGRRPTTRRTERQRRVSRHPPAARLASTSAATTDSG